LTPQVAHAGHWLPQLLYLVPVAVMAALVGWGRLKEKRGRREHGDAERRADGR
jgi:hypothetical protein